MMSIIEERRTTIFFALFYYEYLQFRYLDEHFTFSVKRQSIIINLFKTNG